jgi:hypothetical protein
MEWLISLGAILAGILIRFGVPVTATMLLVLFLRRLDMRWQQETEARCSREDGRPPLFQQIRCWATKDCAPEKRERCPAYMQQVQPCWQTFRSEGGHLREDCLECDVFRKAPLPVYV